MAKVDNIVISAKTMVFLTVKYGLEFGVVNSWFKGNVKHYLLDLFEEERYVEVYIAYDSKNHTQVIVEVEN